MVVFVECLLREKLKLPDSTELRRRGVVILPSGKLQFEKITEISDKEGRFILVRGKIEGSVVTFLNVYANPFFQENCGYDDITDSRPSNLWGRAKYTLKAKTRHL